MTRALEATQDDRATSSAIVPVDLIRLTTYSDRVALTVANTYHFSRFSCYWDFFDEGTSRFFSPHVSEIGLLGFTMNHIPGQQDDGLLARGLEVRLANNDLEGERLAVTLLADNLAGARDLVRAVVRRAGQADVSRVVIGGESVVPRGD